ncbi:MAG: hypothetical protein ABIS50_23775 [Luteolibacter sp.]|uniref:hypothetical protein n=1 Tax=Luteolibacter sp. TaxID=1962973 RepID=UPI00326724CC
MKINPPQFQSKGFALIVTLSLMILLTVIAVGLLTLSSISLRSSGQGDAMAKARSNARLALMLAIGQLQKTAGPDQRITAPANLVNSTAPTGVTGVWKSWRPPVSSPDYTSAKGGKNFLGYLMSDSDPAKDQDPKELPAVSSNAQKLVGPISVGSGNSSAEISAPLVTIATGKTKSATGAISYVTLDEGVKGRIDLLPSEEPKGLGETITQVGSSARNGFETVEKMDFLKDDRTKLKETLPKLVTLNQASLKSTSTDAVAKYFHDFTVSSNSLQVDVANGGLKTDLSMLFEGTSGAALNVGNYGSRYLYSDTTTPFQGAATSSDVQWSLYANYARLYRRTTSNDNPRDGMKATTPSGILRSIGDTTLKKTRYEPNMAILKQPLMMPTVVRVDTLFSLVTHDAHAGRANATYPYMLHLMYLPVITLHNPYNVPLRVTNLQVEFSDIPVAFDFLINDLPATTSGLTTLNNFYVSAGGQKKTFNMQLSNSLTGAAEVVMGAGETRIFGTPFKPDTNWGAETSSNGSGTGLMFDWQSNQTAGAYSIPGMITSSKVGIGFDVDWLAPANRSAWLTTRRNDGVVMLKADDRIKVRYAPQAPATADNSFSITTRMGSGTSAPEVARTQVFYMNNTRLKSIMEEGTSERFPDARSFPETCPRSTESPITTMSLYEANTRPIKDYALSRPFAVFSVTAKTTMESFTKSRPITDTGIAFQMATCDFTTKSSAGSSPLEFGLVPVKQGGVAIESGGLKDSKGTSLQAFMFGGHGTRNGTNNSTLYEIPMSPLQSIAQLRHANAGSLGSEPFVTYTVGESRAHPAVPSDAAFVKADSSRTVLDRSWLANDQLWDKYWFSTLSTLQGTAYTGTSASTQQQLASAFFAGTKTLPNPRNAAYIPSGKSASQVATTACTLLSAAPFTQSADYILTRGGFNVNSTSIAAWTSVLSALSTSDVPVVGGSTEKDPAGTPFLRVRQPVSGSKLLPKEKLWNSYRTLDANEISTLAKAIVEEVKARGPFLSMSEFVNRRLGAASDPMSQKGAIQAALDRTNLNVGMELNARTVAPADVSGYGWINPSAVDKNTGSGAPGEVSQGDILSAIGSFVSVRSDTFRIRSYGDTRNASGQVIARAWCEATLQRLPEYVESTDLPEAVATAPANLNFGRQFKVVAFRWLSPDEI